MHAYLFPRKRTDWQVQSKLDLTDTIKDGARLFMLDARIRRQLLLALTEDSKLHIQEVLIISSQVFINKMDNQLMKLLKCVMLLV